MAASCTLARLLLICAAPLASSFMSNWKPPSVSDFVQRREAEGKFGDKKLVVVTGTSSGLGRKTARALLNTGRYVVRSAADSLGTSCPPCLRDLLICCSLSRSHRYHVVGAVRDLDKMEVVAELDGFSADLFTPMHVELNSFESVRDFCRELNLWKSGKPIDRLICNAAVYQPSLDYAKWSVDGHEQQMQINYLSHFLLTSLLLEDISRAPDPRVIFVGSVTGNDNTVGGGGVYPIADLKQLDGLKAGARNPISMFDGYNFDGAKGYKDSKLCLMMTSNLLHDFYHKQTGIGERGLPAARSLSSHGAGRRRDNSKPTLHATIAYRLSNRLR